MRFKAELSGVDGLERPRVIYGKDVGTLKTWGREMLEALSTDKRAGARITIYERQEVPIVTILGQDVQA